MDPFCQVDLDSLKNPGPGFGVLLGSAAWPQGPRAHLETKAIAATEPVGAV